MTSDSPRRLSPACLVSTPARKATLITAGVAAAAVAGTLYAGSRVARRRIEAAPDADLLTPAGVTGHLVEMRDGTKLQVTEAGDGPTVVLVHGAGLSSGVWSYQFHDLTDRFRLVAPDLRAHGESDVGSEGVTIAAMADDLAEVFDRLDLHASLLVGHSMGGMAVLRLARRHPDLLAERVSSVLLVSTAGGVLPFAGPASRFAPLAVRAAVTLDSVSKRSSRLSIPDSNVGHGISRVGFGVRPSPAQVAATLRMLQATDQHRLIGLLPELMRFDERTAFTDLKLPVTVLVGDRDRLTPPDLARQLAASLPGARLIVWPGAGHMLMFERREALDWLIASMATAPAPVGDGAATTDSAPDPVHRPRARSCRRRPARGES